MVILEGYSAAGMWIVVLGHSIGCQVVWVTSRLDSRLDGGGPGGNTWQSPGQSVSLSRGLTGASTKRILSDNVNCRNYEYYTVCDISMCCRMDLSMYSNVYEDCVVNPSRDKCWIVR